MRQFLLYGHVLTTEEIEAHAEEGVPEKPPTLNQFKEQVSVIRLNLMKNNSWGNFDLQKKMSFILLEKVKKAKKVSAKSYFFVL